MIRLDTATATHNNLLNPSYCGNCESRKGGDAFLVCIISHGWQVVLESLSDIGKAFNETNENLFNNN